MPNLFSQTTRDKSIFDMLDSDTKAKQPPFVIDQADRPALEGTVDPEKYYVGPSDKISVNIWISPPVNFILTVTPEGTLIIPTVGDVKVSDKTLAETKQIIISKVKKKYIAGDVTVSLISPRPIVILVTGNVLFPGSFVLSSTDRAEKAIQVANNQSVQHSMSTRNITLKRKDGTVVRVDLKKYYATTDDQFNPYLREGDHIFVPTTELVKNVIGIYGNVNAPGRYEYVSGEYLTDAIKIAFGFTHRAVTDSIELHRLDITATKLQTQIFSYTDIIDGKAPNIPLEPGDRIIVKGKIEQREDFRVFISGEVLHPGTYPITKNSTKLSEAIEYTGGFTQFASLKSAEVYRTSISPKEIDLERKMSMRGSVSPDDSLIYLIETELRLQKEIVNVDFEKLFLHNEKSQDIILQDGDYIQIPSVKRTVYIFGQVLKPGHIQYTEAGTIDYYISKCGGLTDAARKCDIKIIKSKTMQWLDPDETTVGEGDYIWVPKKIERSFSYYTTVLSQTASIFSVVIGMAIVIIQLTK